MKPLAGSAIEQALAGFESGSFCSDSPLAKRHRFAEAPPTGNVTISESDKHKDYTRYAEHCLKMVTLAKDRNSRAIQREMAAE
jgi:hypothetical protein